MARTFGARFLEEFRLAGGSTARWSPQALEAMMKADRRTFPAALGRASSEAAKALTIAANVHEPETLARRAVPLMHHTDPGRPDSGWVDPSLPFFTSD